MAGANRSSTHLWPSPTMLVTPAAPNLCSDTWRYFCSRGKVCTWPGAFGLDTISAASTIIRQNFNAGEKPKVEPADITLLHPPLMSSGTVGVLFKNLILKLPDLKIALCPSLASSRLCRSPCHLYGVSVLEAALPNSPMVQ